MGNHRISRIVGLTQIHVASFESVWLPMLRNRVCPSVSDIYLSFLFHCRELFNHIHLLEWFSMQVNQFRRTEATCSRPSSALGADICNNPRNNYYGRSQLSTPYSIEPKALQSGEFQCSWEVKLCKSIILVVHVCKQWPMKRHVSR